MKPYIEWLKTFGSYKEAISEAFREGVATGDGFISEILRKAHQELINSKDPAVKYFAETLTVLPKQPRDAVPCVEWLGPEKYQSGKVSTPGGEHLGFIFRRPDGLWNIMPGTAGPGTLSAISETQTDARCYLASILTRPTRATVNGAERNLRIVGEEDDLFRRNHNQVAKLHEEEGSPQWPTHQVEFWDDNHDITGKDNVRLEVPSKSFKGAVDVLEGIVTGVAGQKVCIFGIESF